MIGAHDPGAWARLTLMGMMWGGSYVAIAVALRDMGPLTVAAARLVLATVALAAAARVWGARMPGFGAPGGRRVWAFALAMAMLSNAAPFVLLAWAQQHVAAGVAAIFMALLPLATLPLAHLFIPGEGLTTRKAAGFAVGVAGTITLIGPQALGDMGGAGLELLAELACVAVVLSYACGSIVAKRAPAAHPIAMSAAMAGLAAVAIVPVALVVEQPWTVALSAEAAAAMVWLALLSTALGQVLTLQVLARAGPSFLSLVNFMIPIWGLAFAALLLSETPPLRAALALPLILLGVAIARGARPVREVAS